MFSSFITALATISFSLFGGLPFMFQGAAVAYTSANIANEAPTVLTLSLSGHTQTSYENQRAITFIGTAKDLNGDVDITKVSLDFFRNNGFNASNCASDPNNCYHVTSCLLSYAYGNDVTISYNCFVSIAGPYAYGDWKAVITVTDQSLATGTRSAIATVVRLGTEGLTGVMPPLQPEPTVPLVPLEEEVIPTQPTTTDATQPETKSEETLQDSDTEGSDDSIIAGIDRIAQFYQRIEKSEPLTRGGPNHTESYGEPLIVAANNTGLAVFDLSTGEHPTRGTTLGVIIDVPAGASSDWITIYVDPLGAGQFPVLYSAMSTPIHLLTAQAAGIQIGDRAGISPVGFTVFHIYARNSRGNEITAISSAARITLILPEDLSTKKNPGLYRLNKNKNAWEEYRYEEYDEYTLAFKTSDLGFFAIFSTDPIEQSELPEQALGKLTCLISIIILLLVLVGLIILLIVTLRREHHEDGRQKKAPLFRKGHPTPPVNTPID